MKKHLIWGDVEATLCDSSSTSLSRSDGDGSGSLRGVGENMRCVVMRRLPEKVQAYLPSVDFQEDSRSSNSGTMWRRRTSTPGPIDVDSAAVEAGNELELESPEREGPADLGADVSALENVVRNLEEKERDALIGEVLQSSQFWCVGSASHSAGKCRPCHYIHTKTGCTNGRDCPFCHVPHTKRGRKKPGKSKRIRCHEFASTLEGLDPEDREYFMEAMWSASSRSLYLRSILEKRLQQKEEVPAEASDASRRRSILSL